MARLLTLKEIRTTKGAGWLETWFPPDDGEPEYKLLTECAWLHGAIINRNSPRRGSRGADGGLRQARLWQTVRVPGVG